MGKYECIGVANLSELHDGLRSMVLVFFGGELGKTETNIVVLAEMKKIENLFTPELVDEVLKTTEFPWPSQ